MEYLAVADDCGHATIYARGSSFSVSAVTALRVPQFQGLRAPGHKNGKTYSSRHDCPGCETRQVTRMLVA